MYSLLSLVSSLITLYVWVLIFSAVLSWLIAFDLVNRRSSAVQTIAYALARLTEPLLRPIRSLLPDLGGIDVSPVILILLLFFARNLLWEFYAGLGAPGGSGGPFIP